TLEHELAQWPDELRATMCGMTWDDQFFDGEPNPRSTIVRYLRFDRHFSGRYNDGLRMRGRDLDADTMRAMCASPGVRHLTRINFAYQLDARGVGELATCPHFHALEELSLEGCTIGNAPGVIAALATAPFFGRLNKLELYNTNIAGADVEPLLVEPGPKTIGLGSNPLGVAGAHAIARRLRGETERGLRVNKCDLGNEGMGVLAT